MILLAFADGGFFSWAWRPAAAAFASAAALAVVVRGRAGVTRLQLLVIGAMTALCAWVALSSLWSVDPHGSMQEVERTLVYLTALLAAVAIGGALLEGALAGIVLVCAYAVGSRVVEGGPFWGLDALGGTLLEEPLGYANALGGLAAIGAASAIALLVEQPRRRVLLGAVVALLAVTLVLTVSRAGVGAAVVGAAVALALGAGRQALARAITGSAGIALVVVLALPAGSLADDLARGGGDRPFYWHVAWKEIVAAPLTGNGAGTFWLSWLEHQPAPVAVRDAHSIYLETAAELGVVGLALLVLALAPPLVLALRGGVGAAAAGGYVAFLVHAGLDWDWEVPAVTVAGLLCGAALLLDAAQTGRASSGATPHLPSRGYRQRNPASMPHCTSKPVRKEGRP